LNPFIAYYEPRKSSYEVVITGGLKEIRPKRQLHPFAYFAYALNDYRDELFRKCVDWKLPAESFISGFDPLLRFYSQVLNYHGEPNQESILRKYLIKPLRFFLFSLDIQFHTNYYFYNKMKEMNSNQLCVEVFNVNGKPAKNESVSISTFDSLVTKSLNLVRTVQTSKKGNAECFLPDGIYYLQIEKYGLHKVCYLDEDRKSVTFITPKKKHWWNKS
jgi:hypothetical protein